MNIFFLYSFANSKLVWKKNLITHSISFSDLNLRAMTFKLDIKIELNLSKGFFRLLKLKTFLLKINLSSAVYVFGRLPLPSRYKIYPSIPFRSFSLRAISNRPSLSPTSIPFQPSMAV